MVPLRHKLLVDSDVQVALLRRTALYATACALYFTIILLCSESMSNPEESIGESLARCMDDIVFWLPGFAILAPVIAYDILRITNRFTGPIYRLRREMMRLIEGDQVQALSFREDDYWNEMAELFNRVKDEMLELREAKVSGQHPEAPSETQPQPRLFEKDDEEQEAEEFLVTSEG